MNKKVVLSAVAIVVLGYMMFDSDEAALPDHQVNQVALPTFEESVNKNPVPILEAKTFQGNGSFFRSMKSEDPEGLYRYGLAFNQVLKAIVVRENVINGKPSVRFPDSGTSGSSVQLTPPGLLSGLSYTGKSNFNRVELDQLAYGAVSAWLGTSDPKEIGKIYFGKDYDSHKGFLLSLLDFQRQIVVTNFGLQKLGFSYQSVSEEYMRLTSEFLDKGLMPKAEQLAAFEATVMSNVKNIANFSGTALAKSNKRESNKIALLLIQFFIFEDIKLLNSLKTEVSIHTPVPDRVKEDKRILRERREQKARERAEEEKRRSELMQRNTRF